MRSQLNADLAKKFTSAELDRKLDFAKLSRKALKALWAHFELSDTLPPELADTKALMPAVRAACLAEATRIVIAKQTETPDYPLPSTDDLRRYLR